MFVCLYSNTKGILPDNLLYFIVLFVFFGYGIVEVLLVDNIMLLDFISDTCSILKIYFYNKFISFVNDKLKSSMTKLLY